MLVFHTVKQEMFILYSSNFLFVEILSAVRVLTECSKGVLGAQEVRSAVESIAVVLLRIFIHCVHALNDHAEQSCFLV